MKILRKLSEEKGSITMTVVAAMLFITAAILIAYFSLSNQSNDQSKKTRQVADSYKVTNTDLVQKYKDIQDNLNEVTTMSITEVKSLGNTMLAKETNTVVNDELGNNFVVPAGFKVTDDANNVTEGMVIQDKDGNEFVWIPVGIKKKSNQNENITLDRYTFDVNGIPSVYSGSNIEEDTANIASLKNYGNIISKNLSDFISKTNQAKGFYIGRYEARKSSSNKLTEIATDNVYNDVTQPNAAVAARGMYENNSNFECDLINSYAWDTAVLFLQEYDNRSNAIQGNSNYKNKYSMQIRLSTDFKDKGTNQSIESNKDKICNVYDMADNCFEWTTETCNSQDTPCTKRGGRYNSDTDYTSKRIAYATTTEKTTVYSFRPILYIK